MKKAKRFCLLYSGLFTAKFIKKIHLDRYILVLIYKKEVKSFYLT